MITGFPDTLLASETPPTGSAQLKIHRSHHESIQNIPRTFLGALRTPISFLIQIPDFPEIILALLAGCRIGMGDWTGEIAKGLTCPAEVYLSPMIKQPRDPSQSILSMSSTAQPSPAQARGGVRYVSPPEGLARGSTPLTVIFILGGDRQSSRAALLLYSFYLFYFIFILLYFYFMRIFYFYFNF